MHEYSIAQSLIERVDSEVRARGAGAVKRLEVSIGELCGVEPELLATAFATFRERTVCEGAELEVTNVPARWVCLVCPAIYDLGQEANVVVLSVTEGEDKPLKYPVMFRKADLVVLTKIDLLPHLDVQIENIADALARVMPEPHVLALSAKTGEGLQAWLDWLATLAAKQPEHAHAHRQHAGGHL